MNEESLRLDIKDCIIHPLIGRLEDPLTVELTFSLRKTVSDAFWEMQYLIDCIMDNDGNEEETNMDIMKTTMNMVKSDNGPNLEREDKEKPTHSNTSHLFNPLQIIGETEIMDYNQNQDYKVHFNVHKFNLSTEIPIGRLTNCGVLKFVLKTKMTNEILADFHLVTQISEDKENEKGSEIQKDGDADLNEMKQESDVHSTSVFDQKSLRPPDTEVPHFERKQRLKRVIYNIFS